MSENNDLFLTFPPTAGDVRGKIRRINFEGARFSVLSINDGFLRGGEYHPLDEHVLVLKGTIELTLRINDKDVVSLVKTNELITISAQIPHLFKGIGDVVFLEWTNGPIRISYYEPYRKLVIEKMNEKK